MKKSKIINTFCEWAAFSSTRSGAPLKSRADVYPLIRLLKYDEILHGDSIEESDFDSWHRRSVEEICESRSEMNVGWAAKIINVYLKGMVYIAGEGREGLVGLIHPPIDGGLWDGIEEYCKANHHENILKRTHAITTISGIKTYTQYQDIIDGCRDLSNEMGCSLIEVEQLWLGTKF